MTYVRGEDIALGVAMESTPGTFVAAQDYVRSRDPHSIQTIVEKATIKETKLTGVASHGDVITMKKVEGDIPLNLRFRTIGYFLKSLLGGLNSATEAGETIVYRHTVTLNTAVAQPTLSLSHARGAHTHRQIPGAVVTKMALNFPIDDVINGTVSIKGLTETDTSNFTPSFNTGDHLAPHHMVTVKIASAVAGLAGATAINVTDMAIEMDRASRERVALSSTSPLGFIASLLSVSGSFKMDKDDETYRALAIAGTARAMEIKIRNTDQTIGTAAKPELTITLPNVTLDTSEERPLDDTVTEEIKFVAHYDDTEAKAITCSLVNLKATYV
ncbi:phage tail tube protein [Tsuneonella sp. HG222]